MDRSLHVPIAPGRKLGAWVCLMAVLFLWAPLGALALQANGMGCCADGFCAAHGHRKTGKPAAAQPNPAQSPMECEYHDGATKKQSGAMNCAMSSCHQQEAFATSAAFFVLPLSCTFSQPAEMKAARICFAPASFVPSHEPLSPPPRHSFSSL